MKSHRVRRLAISLLLLAALGVGLYLARALSFRGRVVAGERPVAGARIGIKGQATRVESDQAGGFQFGQMPRPGDRITATAPGFYIGGADFQLGRATTIQLKPHPTDDSPGYTWIDPNPDPAGKENCAHCHAEIYRQWAGSSHAQSAVNRHFLDAFAGTDWSGRPNVGWNFAATQPDARAVCVACHLPTVAASDPIAEDPTRASGLVREGIHCDFCHKIAGADVSHVGLQHGRDALRLVRPRGAEQLFFGPLDDVDRGRDAFLPLYRSSQICASCHEGTLFGTRAYETYSEWKASSYASRGVECQQCHMKPDGRMTNIAPEHGGIERDPATLATHAFPGSLDEAFLRSSVELELAGALEDGIVRVTTVVRPINVGHRFPTGSPDRHLILVVTAATDDGIELRRSDGPTIPLAGGVGPREAGNFASLPGRLFGKLLEGPRGESPAPFWDAARVVFDTRLMPDEADRAEFRFGPLDDGAPSVRVRAALIYRPFYKAVLDEKSWPDRDMTLAERELELKSAASR